VILSIAGDLFQPLLTGDAKRTRPCARFPPPSESPEAAGRQIDIRGVDRARSGLRAERCQKIVAAKRCHRSC
jgi:hypothetical protein